MSTSPSLLGYLLRDTLVRWRGRVSAPLARLAAAGSLATAALLVLASFALGAATLALRSSPPRAFALAANSARRF